MIKSENTQNPELSITQMQELQMDRKPLKKIKSKFYQQKGSDNRTSESSRSSSDDYQIIHNPSDELENYRSLNTKVDLLINSNGYKSKDSNVKTEISLNQTKTKEVATFTDLTETQNISIIPKYGQSLHIKNPSRFQGEALSATLSQNNLINARKRSISNHQNVMSLKLLPNSSSKLNRDFQIDTDCNLPQLCIKKNFLTDKEFTAKKRRLKELNREQKERELRQSAERTKMEEIFKKEDEEKQRIKEINIQIKEQMKLERNNQIRQRIQDRSKQRELKLTEFKEIQVRSKSVMKQTPLYVTMKNNFDETITKKEIDSRMTKLNYIKLARVTPIDHSEIK